jgi:hypothetical protein
MVNKLTDEQASYRESAHRQLARARQEIEATLEGIPPGADDDYFGSVRDCLGDTLLELDNAIEALDWDDRDWPNPDEPLEITLILPGE